MISGSAFASRMCASQSALSHMLKRMEGANFVTRGKTVKHDSRAALVSLTLRGRRMAQKYDPLFKEIDETWMEGLSLRDRSRLKQTLNNIFERISADFIESEHCAQSSV